MKLELKHLAPYLPYGLKSYDEEYKEIFEVCSFRQDSEEWLIYDNIDGSVVEYSRDILKPILRPLSDLLKEEDFLGIQNLIRVHIGKTKLQKMCADGYGLIDLPYFITDYLFENHFDYFDLIEKGLAIDINTLSE